jgi:SHAQKYF class myb-like DNA-binding protein
MVTGLWSQEEHAKFLVAVKLYPHGPWRKVTAIVGTRSIRQVQTHAQKYHEKVVRRMRGLHKGRRSSGRKEHRIDDDLLAACKVGQNFGVIRSNRVEASLPLPMLPDLGSSELLLPLLLDAAPCPLSPGGVDSNGIVDTAVIVATPVPRASASCHLPTIDESLDFLIERLSKGGTDDCPIKVAL